ncbi:MAG: hypothetical protein PVJ19_00365 [Desulfobacteraceae bacterium]
MVELRKTLLDQQSVEFRIGVTVRSHAAFYPNRQKETFIAGSELRRLS